MNPKILIVLIFAALVAGAGIFLAVSGGDETDTESTTVDNMAEPTPEASATPPDVSQVPGRFVDYKEGVLAEATGQRVLFFHAPWCPQCRAIESDIKQQGVPKGYTIIKVDYDSNQPLRQKYGVTIQTSFVKVDESGGKQGDNYVAYDEPTLAALTRDFLK